MAQEAALRGGVEPGNDDRAAVSAAGDGGQSIFEVAADNLALTVMLLRK